MLLFNVNKRTTSQYEAIYLQTGLFGAKILHHQKPMLLQVLAPKRPVCK